ncbi:MAG: hypothetical protein MZV64_04830 [Ignavibacteriales bacterium]|nr:hypothetical protein [Ignavibacteriales bacterium]
MRRSRRIESGPVGAHREVAGGLGGLNALRVGRHVRLHQRHRLLHDRGDLRLLLRDDLALHAARRRLLRRRGGQLLLLDLAVRARRSTASGRGTSPRPSC